MKKILFSLVALVASMSMNAQVMKVMKNGEEVAKYNGADYTVVFEEAPNPHLLPGSFSVSATKTVKFTKSNLYWSSTDSKFHFEAQPTDYPTTRDQTHVGHFFWTQTAAASYAAAYDNGTNETTDLFFADGRDDAHKLTVDGVSGLYVLSEDEWTYLLNSRPNASGKQKHGVTVTDGSTSYSNCLIIAPDDFTGTIAASYTLDQLDAAGFLCLPAAGMYHIVLGKVYYNNDRCYYWSSSPRADYKDGAQWLYWNSNGSDDACVTGGDRGIGSSLRAVLAEE